MVKNEAGLVAMRFYKNKNHMSKIKPGVDREFHFVVRAGSVSLAWVPEKYVQRVINLEYSCCGNPPLRNMFRLATEAEAAAWLANDASLLS